MHKKGFYEKYFKRLLDVFFSFILIILLLPVYIILIILVRIKLGTPIIFSQERPGYKEKIFKCYKFRTMTNEKNEKGELLDDAKRLTNFGKILRATSLDELPELFNILLGDMSFVGPRPLLVKYLPLYNEEQHRRHDVMPGLTGFAQINGRNDTTWDARFKYDLYYVDNISFLLDFKIVMLTIKKVFFREGISQQGEATMEFFEGNK